MDVPDLAAKGSEHPKWTKALTLEQQRKFDELRERRLQLQKAQDTANSRKKKKRKRGKKGDDMQPEAAHGASEQHHHLPSVEERTITATAAKFGSEHRHIFAVNAGTGTTGEGSISPPTEAGGGEENLDIVPSTTEKSSSAIAVNPDKTPLVPPQKTKRKKLHWGMEVKERWERKGNM